MPEVQSAKAVHVSLDEPLAPIEVGERHDRVLLVASLGGVVLGEVVVPARDLLGVVDQQEAISRALGEQLYRRRLVADFTRAARVERSVPVPSVSVVVRAEGEPTATLESLAALDPPAHEVIVDGREPTGEVVAFLDDGWVVDPSWLAGLGEAFEDRLTMAVTGYVPGDGCDVEVKVHDKIGSLAVPRLPEGNSFFRREAFEKVGPFAGLRYGQEAEFHQRLFSAGWRVRFRPAHIAWRPRHDPFRDGLAVGAYTTYRLLKGDLSVLPTPRSRRRGNLVRALGIAAGPFTLLGRRSAHGAPHTQAQPTADSGQRTQVTAELPSLSVAIASYNRREPLAHLLETFKQQSYPPDRFEIVVVVDGSKDGTAERARALELPYTLRVLEQENRGLAASRNRGASEASAPVVVFIDDDMAPAPDFLAEHAQAHARSSGPVAALGTCPPANPGDDLASLALRHWWEDYYRRRSEPDHQWVYTDFGDGNMSLPRSILDSAGGWDEEFAKETVRRQDWELAIRLIGAGVRFVDVAGATAWHHFEVNLATSMRNRRVEGRADVLLGRKHPHVREHLFLRRYIVDERGRERQYSLFADHPEAGARLIELGRRTAQLLEKGQFRWIAWKSMLRMLSYSYLLGVRQTLSTEEEFKEFIAPMLRHELVDTVPLPIDRPGVLELAAPATGAIDLQLEYGARELARVDALEPEVQWDWDTLTDRVVRDALEPYRPAVGEALPVTPAAAPSP